MPYEIFLALRYLRMRRGRRGATQVTALAAGVGIACGVAALIVALALANGFRDELRDKILRGTAHLTLMPADGQLIKDWRAVVAELRGVEGVVDAHATTYAGALLSGTEGATHTILRGVDREAKGMLTEIRRTLIEGELDDLFHDPAPREIESVAPSNRVGGAPAQLPASVDEERPVRAIIGAELAKRTGLQRVGDEGWMVAASGKSFSVEDFAPHARRVRVVGIFRSGLYDYDASWMYVSLPEAMMIESGSAPDAHLRAEVISVETADMFQTDQVAERVRRALGPRWMIVDWRVANRPLFAALELERRVVAGIVILIMLVAALNITATLVIVVVERRADIAILNALGARASSIMAIFIIEGALVGATGAAVGILLGLGACFLTNHFALIQLPADVYSLSSIALHPRPREVAMVALVALAISLLATLYPARVASRVRPAEALRDK